MYNLEAWPDPISDVQAFAMEHPNGSLVAHLDAEGTPVLYGFESRGLAIAALTRDTQRISASQAVDGSSVRIVEIQDILAALK